MNESEIYQRAVQLHQHRLDTHGECLVSINEIADLIRLMETHSPFELLMKVDPFKVFAMLGLGETQVA